MMNPAHILKIEQLRVSFPSRDKETIAVQNLNLTLSRGRTLGVVGESGSGKSVSALSIMRLLQSPGRVDSGSIYFRDDQQIVDLLSLSEKEMQKIRGRQIGMVFQEPMTSLNPVHRCGDQVAESLRLHLSLSKQAAKERVLSLFEEVELPRVQDIYRSYPHELSGGQKQRIMIAMAISCQPSLLIADEPTTALDVTVQKHIIELLRKLQAQHDMAIIFITHDLGVVAELADDILVMRGGKVEEYAPIEEVFSQPKAQYTQGLLACRPPVDQRLYRLPTIQDFEQVDSSSQENTPPTFVPVSETIYQERLKSLQSQAPILTVRELSTTFSGNKSWFSPSPTEIKAVDGVSFEIYPGETLGLVGESGCGKTTLGRSLLRLIEPSAGSVHFQDKHLQSLNAKELRAIRKHIQIIFQDPYSSLNPRLSIGSAIEEPMIVHGIGTSKSDRQARVVSLLKKVGLQADHASRYPHEFSGGQRQRICIARTLALNPDFIICDESVSALDVSVQAQVLNLLKSLQEESNLTYLFISHDLSVVKYMSDRILVMKEGKIVEQGDAERVFHHPEIAYTQDLIASIPKGTLSRIKELKAGKSKAK